MSDARPYYREPQAKDAVDRMYENGAIEPTICKQFACGRQLTLEEMRFGQYCVAHKKPNNWNSNHYFYRMVPQ